jgi:spore photoproduct lyase
MGSFATKYVNTKLLDYNPNGKIRIRFSLMPGNLQKILEPNTSSIYDRLKAVSLFLEAGYEVHLNFSPVVVYDHWKEGYKKLFESVSNWSTRYNWNNDRVKAEVIFLTHNNSKHIYNTLNDIPGEDLIWRPDIQEIKTSQYGGENIRYKHDWKAEYIKEFIKLHDEIIPWNTIRYIF